MTDIERLKYVMNESAELASNGENEKALKLLDDLIAQAMRENKDIWVSTLCRHASVICRHAGELDLAKRYSERVLTYRPNDPPSLYALADVCFRQGEKELAKRHAARCYEVCVRRNSEEDRALIEVLLKQWPELGTPTGQLPT